MAIRASKKDIIWNYVGIIVSMGSNFVLLPFMMYFIESDYLGLWYVYTSIGGIVTLFDFGFNPTFARNIAYCWSGATELNAEGVVFSDKKEVNLVLLRKVITVCKRIYLMIALTALFVMLSVGSVYIRFVSADIFDVHVVVSWLIYSCAIFLNLYYGYYATFLRGSGSIAEYNKINVTARVTQIMVSIVLMLFGYGIIAASCAYLLYGLLLRRFSQKTFYRKDNLQEKLKAVPETVDAQEIKDLFFVVWHNAWRDGVVSIANYCASQASTLIASFYLSLTETGIYSIAVQLSNAIVTVGGGLYSAYQPAMQSAHLNGQREESERLMATAITAYDMITVVGTAALLLVGLPFLNIIKPETEFDYLVTLGISAYYYIYKRQSYFTSYISNTNQVPYMKAHLVTSLAGMVMSVLLLSKMNLGVWGIILGQMVPQLAYNCWKWPQKVYLLLETNGKKMFKIGFWGVLDLVREIVRVKK